MAEAPQIDLSRLADIPRLGGGSHDSLSYGACVMEAVSYIAGEPWSDEPLCACPVISTFLRSWNDNLPDDERDTLLRPFIPLLIGTRKNEATERRRSLMAADWLVRVHTPAWLRLAGLATQADSLANLPEITDMAQCPSLMSTLEAVRSDADAVSAAARGSAAWAVAWDAARAAAASAAARAAAAVSAAAWGAAWVAAWVAARTAASASAAASDALKTTRTDLQGSAVDLVHRMIAVTEAP